MIFSGSLALKGQEMLHFQDNFTILERGSPFLLTISPLSMELLPFLSEKQKNLLISDLIATDF